MSRGPSGRDLAEAIYKIRALERAKADAMAEWAQRLNAARSALYELAEEVRGWQGTLFPSTPEPPAPAPVADMPPTEAPSETPEPGPARRSRRTP